MRDYVEIGSVPSDEDCEQVGTATYDPVRAKNECRAFRDQLIRTFGGPPETALLKIVSNPHDFGVYYEVRCTFQDNDEVGEKYAYMLEEKTPENWDDEARTYLGLKEESQ